MQILSKREIVLVSRKKGEGSISRDGNVRNRFFTLFLLLEGHFSKKFFWKKGPNSDPSLKKKTKEILISDVELNFDFAKFDDRNFDFDMTDFVASLVCPFKSSVQAIKIKISPRAGILVLMHNF